LSKKSGGKVEKLPTMFSTPCGKQKRLFGENPSIFRFLGIFPSISCGKSCGECGEVLRSFPKCGCGKPKKEIHFPFWGIMEIKNDVELVK
jgi:hypothetical protein